MHEQTNIDLVNSLYEAFGRGDTGARHDETGVLSFFQAQGSTLDDMKLTADHYLAQGDVVATFGRFAGTVKATGKRFDTPVGHYFKIHGGKVAEFNNILETAGVAAAYTSAAAAAH